MTAKVVRIIMVLLTVFIGSIVIPDFYRTSFKRNVKYVSLNYSEVTKQFVIWGLKKDRLLDTLGNEYSRQEYERMVPFSSMAQLMKRGEFPDTVDGVPVTPQLVAANSYTSVAFPAISTGVYGYPRAAAAEIAVKTVSEFITRHALPEQVYFVCYDEENAHLYERLLTQQGDE